MTGRPNPETSVIERDASGAWFVKDDDVVVAGPFETNREAWSWLDHQHRDPLWRGRRHRFRSPEA